MTFLKWRRAKLFTVCSCQLYITRLIAFETIEGIYATYIYPN